jgi:hypothetical protein
MNIKSEKKSKMKTTKKAYLFSITWNLKVLYGRLGKNGIGTVVE